MRNKVFFGDVFNLLNATKLQLAPHEGNANCFLLNYKKHSQFLFSTAEQRLCDAEAIVTNEDLCK